jgi:FtsP/CotA-like multicopper oxidase with cupredoxin domain
MNPLSNLLTKTIVLGLVLTAGASLASAAEFYLRAGETTVIMPDGREVPMWGFAQDSAFGAEDGTVVVPGPVLTVPDGDSTVVIHLDNNLPAGNPVSIVIPGQTATMVPVRHAAGSPYEGRVRSFAQEAAPGNSEAVTYTFSNFRPGTFLYHSGTHPACQVQMGLYGCVKKDAGEDLAYAGVAYDREVVMLVSEIDPDFHDAVQDGNFGSGKSVTSTMDYRPQYFLVNGQPYGAGTSPIDAGGTGDRVLIRFLNAGITSHAFLLQGLHMRVLAEDGFPYRHARERYCVNLPALKTLDVLVTSENEGTFPLYDRTLHLTNGLESPGGMLAFLEIGNEI